MEDLYYDLTWLHGSWETTKNVSYLSVMLPKEIALVLNVQIMLRYCQKAFPWSTGWLISIHCDKWEIDSCIVPVQVPSPPHFKCSCHLQEFQSQVFRFFLLHCSDFHIQPIPPYGRSGLPVYLLAILVYSQPQYQSLSQGCAGPTSNCKFTLLTITVACGGDSANQVHDDVPFFREPDNTLVPWLQLKGVMQSALIHISVLTLN